MIIKTRYKNTLTSGDGDRLHQATSRSPRRSLFATARSLGVSDAPSKKRSTTTPPPKLRLAAIVKSTRRCSLHEKQRVGSGRVCEAIARRLSTMASLVDSFSAVVATKVTDGDDAIDDTTIVDGQIASSAHVTDRSLGPSHAEIRAAVPSRCFERSLTKSIAYLLADYAAIFASYLLLPYFESIAGFVGLFSW